MKKPPYFEYPKIPHHVCKLKRSLYGLKQALRTWFDRLSQFPMTNGFICSKADPSLFVFKNESIIIYMLIYVDDIYSLELTQVFCLNL